MMLHQTRRSACVLLRCSQKPLNVPATGSTGQSLGQAMSAPTMRRLSSRSTVSAGKEKIQRNDRVEPTSSANSIYPDSKASARRNPHAPQLFQHFRRRNIGQDPSPSQAARQRVSGDSYILRNVSTDPELKQLYTALGKAADIHDAVQAIKLCQLIKERKQQISDPPCKVTFDPEEKVVFLSAMRALSHHGFLEEVKAVNADMLSFGFEECIDSLNHLLEAAIVSADEGATNAILDQILALEPSTSSASSHTVELAKLLLKEPVDTASTSLVQAPPMILPVEKMQNWNATTFAHMIDSACQDHNLEFALLLFSACYRAKLTLPHDTLSRLITLCLHSEEFRTAVELADLMEEGGLVHLLADQNSIGQASLGAKDLVQSEARSGQVARRLPPSTWMTILRSCAEGGYLPGVELAWTKAVAQGLQSPDDGLILTILALAAKEGSVQLARVCLHHIDPTYETQESQSTPMTPASESAPPASRKLMTPSKRMELQEWHLAPLFEAQCSARDYVGALRTLRGYHNRGFNITERITSRMSTSIYPDKASLQLARDALQSSATDPAVGTHIAAANAILAAAVWLGDLTQALEIYRAIPTYYDLAPPTSVERRHPRTKIKPNLDTFNALLSGCIDAADYETGVELLKDLNELRVKPTAVTFERMIVLCLTQRNYDNAFGFLEEAREKGVTPSRKSYEALVRKCFRERDLRWERVLDDMMDYGYRPSPRLLRELDIDPESFIAKPRSRFM